MRRGTETAHDRGKRFFWALAILLLVTLGSAASSQGREITDMFGKKVSVPDSPRKVYSTSPPVTYMLYALDPSMLAGLNFPVRPWQKRYLDKHLLELPILGGWFGQAATPNLEMILKVNPEILVTSSYDSAMKTKVDEAMKRMPMPVISVSLNSLTDYPGAFSYLGRVLGRKSRGKELSDYSRSTLAQMSALATSISPEKRVSVYYAEGVDGLSTECDSSQHAELIPLVGGRNVHRCRSAELIGLEKVSFEQVLLYNPEVILVMEDVFYRKIFSDPLWQRLRAVKNKRVYLIPREPFNWFDRPPSFVRLLGAKWVASCLYPTIYRTDMVKETRNFFKLFFKINLSPEEARELLHRGRT
ncbi:iron complex transport system substrate-binding protein [Syntrophus gentianae]|uniref:Iron complex transport system substrate-binding protein n=1 Tax=Syntrophus gentianae TaxID=43775 RepID=A0A1H8A9L8_9BACT|nr:ABC transporter substrate-binding protein [Syntrophus gentianae]SEM67390.1 iron complex transport system substrate-binding protein [Syntrophus gentianae]